MSTNTNIVPIDVFARRPRRDDHSRDRVTRVAHDHVNQCAGLGVVQIAAPDADPFADPPRKCKKSVVWRINRVGIFCHTHYEAYFAAHWRDIDIKDIVRLSECEGDFFAG
jgi:hypothetical protein